MKKKDKGKGGFRLAAGLLLTVCMIFAGALLGGAMTAEAAGETPTIDFSGDTEGSITIHKYEYNRPANEEGTAGTGKPNDSVPGNATALEGVEFTLYQVKDAKALEAIYQGVGADEMPKLDDYWNGTSVTGGATIYKPDGYENPRTTAKDENGDAIVTFDNLPVGIYLVVETDAPKNVTTRSDAFFVSIPTTVDNNDWLYNVHVFPKNATTHGKTVTLIKLGKDGTTETGTPLTGVTFVLQQYNEESKKWETWKGEEKDESGNNKDKIFTTDVNGEITISDLPHGKYRLVETGLGDNTGYIADLSKTYEFVVNEDGTIAKNVDANDDSYIALDAVNGTATITVINEKPDVDKEVKKGNGWAQEADYSIGDTISYRIKIRVPANIEKLTKFWVKDTPSDGIQYTGNLKVYEAAADGTMSTTTIEADGNYTIGTLPTDTDAPEDGFIVKFTTTSDTIKQQAGKTIYITYDAVLQSTASSTTETVKAGNTNTVELVFSKYIKPTDDDDDDYPDLPDDEDDKIQDNTVVYTFKLDIVKDGKTATGATERLNGVKFDLYKEVATEAESNVSVADATAAGLDATKKWKKINTAAPLVTAGKGEDGKDLGQVSIGGLANGTYYLVETETIAGYNLLSKPIKVELSTTYKTGYKNSNNGTGGTEEGTEGGTEEGTGDGAKKIIIKHEIDPDGTEITQTIYLNRDGEGGDSVSEITILNTKGFTLPTTGGAGGFLFALVGCVVMIVGIMIFKGTKKKPESE